MSYTPFNMRIVKKVNCFTFLDSEPKALSLSKDSCRLTITENITLYTPSEVIPLSNSLRRCLWHNDYGSKPIRVKLFTLFLRFSHRHHYEHNLINMNGRTYDPVISRFTSPDILIQSPTNSQSFNRYIYVWNNPLKYNDPTGYETNDDGMGDSDYDNDGNGIDGFDGDGDGGYDSEKAHKELDDMNAQLQQVDFEQTSNYKYDHSYANDQQAIENDFNNSNLAHFDASEGNDGLQAREGWDKWQAQYDNLHNADNMNQVLQNEFASKPVYQPTNYQLKKASAKLFDNISNISLLAGWAVPAIALSGTLSKALSYSIDPDKDFTSSSSAVSSITTEIHERTRSK